MQSPLSVLGFPGRAWSLLCVFVRAGSQGGGLLDVSGCLLGWMTWISCAPRQEHALLLPCMWSYTHGCGAYSAP